MRNVTSYVVQFWTVLTLIVLATFKSDTVEVTVPLSTMSKKCDSDGASQLVA